MNSSANLAVASHEIDWQFIPAPTNAHYRHNDSDKIKMSFHEADKYVSHDHLKIYIGRDFAKKLNWEKKEKLVIMHNPDNLFHLLIVKGESGRSMQTRNEHSFVVTTPWLLAKLNYCSPKQILSEIKDDKLIVWLDKFI